MIPRSLIELQTQIPKCQLDLTSLTSNRHLQFHWSKTKFLMSPHPKSFLSAILPCLNMVALSFHLLRPETLESPLMPLFSPHIQSVSKSCTHPGPNHHHLSS